MLRNCVAVQYSLLLSPGKGTRNALNMPVFDDLRLE
jgi:hypothetical protein